MSVIQTKAKNAKMVAWVWAFVILGLLLLSTSCTSVDSMRAVGGFGLANVRGERVGLEESARDSGPSAGLAFEVTSRSESFENVEVGLRVGAQARSIDTEHGGADIELESLDFHAAPVLRYLIPVTEDFSLYAQGMAGYGHVFGDSTIGPVRSNDNGGGFVFGAGLGAQLRVSDSTSALLGVEWMRTDVRSLDQLDVEAEDLSATFGFVVDF